MTAATQLRIVVPTEARPSRAPVVPDGQVINLTIERDEKLLLSVVEAAHRLGVGRTLMYELLGSGQIETMHVGRLHKVPAEALTAFVERQRRSRTGVGGGIPAFLPRRCDPGRRALCWESAPAEGVARVSP